MDPRRSQGRLIQEDTVDSAICLSSPVMEQQINPIHQAETVDSSKNGGIPLNVPSLQEQDCRCESFPTIALAHDEHNSIDGLGSMQAQIQGQIGTSQPTVSNSVFLFSSPQSNPTHKPRAWKREARDKRTPLVHPKFTTGSVKRKEEQDQNTTVVTASLEKRGKGIGVDGEQIIVSAGTAMQAYRSP
ncbi:hypothetical protein SLE2022_241570 [Rubroshorea leprosula]